MKISTVVIAHNEELWIEKCLESLFGQSLQSDEIIVVLHNCTDRTKEITQKFPVKIIECFEEGSSIISRARGIEASSGEIVCCTDGDCWVDNDWVKNISEPLIKNGEISIVAGYTKIQNGWFWKFSCWWQFVIQRKLFNRKNHRFAWGSNFAFRRKDYEDVGGLFPFLKIHKDLKINYWAEDLYISLALQKVGKIFYALRANVFTYMPEEKSSIVAQKEIVKKQTEDNKKLFSFFKI
ncbi:MAG: glycosyltransferase [Candidatus Pacebacteria bacterium]|nr:glycosyltransferase [Candidatus Paceibacterota bacterium]